MALSRAKLYWMVPSWGAAAKELPVETQLLLLELEVGGACCASRSQRVDPKRSVSRGRSHIWPVLSALECANPQGDQRYGLLAPLIDRDSFRCSLRPPRRRLDQTDGVLLRVESGDESVRDNRFEGAVAITQAA